MTSNARYPKRRALSPRESRESNHSSPISGHNITGAPASEASPSAAGATALFTPEDLDQFRLNPTDDLEPDRDPSSQEEYRPQKSQTSESASHQAPLDTLSMNTHMTGSRLQTFNRLASRADLDDHHQAIGRRVFSAVPEDHLMALMLTVLAGRQHMTAIHEDLSRQILEVWDFAEKGVSTTTTNTPWLTKEQGLELRSCIRQMAHLQIGRGDLQSYTAIKNRNGPPGKLPLSFFATVIDAILTTPAEWKKRLLPPGFGKNPNPKYLKAFHTLVNTVCKDIRKEFETNVIENIQLPGRITSVGNEKVPKLREVIVKHAGSVGGRVQRLALHIWPNMALELFDIVMQLKDITKFELPSEREIRETRKELDKQYPGQLAGNEGDHKGNDLVENHEDEGDDQENEPVEDDADEDEA
ncbi:uncharacterized protein MELLADRAFT_84895 [Melampsora larici-populina 98AG31]|uniref:Uncharacterized protein n=1 Tax=Melampsora larici-populina (strain 98AG31 / pathotype 3-4-7) TaxID=747676 RepID=F4RH56_MELLP|nr:uncharacterized protein MELLADRAFT_84895 [Melampsora larici-populina 98AG31]EGG08138.1 hypothetical protein MELLADRAFT_84895 [Melampsora larici-populina 98AG31]